MNKNDKFFESSEFITNLNDWLFKANQKSASFLYKNRHKIPLLFRQTHNQFLYRGMFLANHKVKGFKTEFSSFSLSEDSAKNFILNIKFSIQSKKDVRCVIKKKIPQSHVILNVFDFVSIYGENKLIQLGLDEMNIDSVMKEYEVLIAPILIKSNDIEFV